MQDAGTELHMIIERYVQGGHVECVAPRRRSVGGSVQLRPPAAYPTFPCDFCGGLCSLFILAGPGQYDPGNPLALESHA